MTTATEPTCPVCSGAMWNNIATKRNPRQPDFKCKNKSCDGVVWPARNGNGNGAPAPTATTKGPHSAGPYVPGLDDAPTASPAVDPFHAEAYAAVLAPTFGKYDACLKHAVDAAAKYPTANLDIAAMAATIFIQVSRA